MPTAASAERRPTLKPTIGVVGCGGGGSTEPENLPCPRCESTNTKFCYYNNYNLSQPRYFCKACRRYWTRGGSLRNIPFGGGHRKNSKRPRPSSSSSSSPTRPPQKSTPGPTEGKKLEILSGPDFGSGSPVRGEVNLNEEAVVGGVGVGPGGGGGLSFSSLLGGQGNCGGMMMGLSGFGLSGLGPEDMGFGLGFGKVEMPSMVGDGPGLVVDEGGVGSGGYNTWQLSLGDGCLGMSDGGDCFSWPDLAISMPSKGLE